MGKILIIIGVFFIIAGLMIAYKINIPYIGRLPGDFSYKSDHVSVYFPLASSIIISIILSLLFYLYRR